jgi:hypothetical protein
MSKRTAKFVSAIFASLVAGAPLTTVSHSAPGPTGDCLAGPKGATPAGGHWYYRIDHATQRQCWYIRDAEKLSRVAPQNSPPSVDPVSPQKEAATPRSVANAHAELPWPQTRIEQTTTTAPAQQRTPAAAVDATGGATAPRVDAADANARASLVASRWPGQADVRSSDGPEQTAANSIANMPASSKAAAPPAVGAVVPLATADSSSKSQFGSVQMWLAVMMGTLSLAAVMGGAVFRFGGKRRMASHEMRRSRRVNWDAAYPGSEARMPIVDMPREQRAADDPNRRITEMLARLSRSAAA